MHKLRIIFLALTLSSCSALPKKKFINDAPIVEVDGEKLVSVQAAFDLSFSSYLKACVEINHFHGKKGVFKACSRQARTFIEDLMSTLHFKKDIKSSPSQ